MEMAVLNDQDIPLVTQILWDTPVGSIFQTCSQRVLLVTNQPAQVGLQIREKKDVIRLYLSWRIESRESGSLTTFDVEGPREE